MVKLSSICPDSYEIKTHLVELFDSTLVYRFTKMLPGIPFQDIVDMFKNK